MTPDLGRLVVLARPWWRGLALGVVLQWATVTASLGLMATSAWLISTAGLHPSIAVVQVAVVGVRFFGISRGVVRYLERLVTHDVTLRLLATLRVAVFTRLVPLAPARLANERSGDVLGRLVGDIETLDQFYLRVAGPAASALLVALTTAVLLLPFDPILSVVALVGLACGGLFAPWVAWRLGQRHAAAVVGHRAALEAAAVDSVQGVAELVAFGREEDHLEALHAIGGQTARAEVAGARGGAAGAALGAFFTDLTVVALLVLAIPLVGRGDLQGVNLAVVALATLAAFEAVALLPPAVQQLGASRQAARRVFALFDAPPAVSRPTTPLPMPEGPRLSVRGLSFAYGPGEPPALDGVTFELGPGRLLAVVGPSGAGKSTLANVLLRFWDVPAGAVSVDGVDVRDLDPDQVRARFAFAGQRADLLTGTLAENLRVGRPDASDAQLEAALERVGLGAWLHSLPAGLTTSLGEQGQALSGGERQRVALARALLRPAPFLLLDEPTAHVDASAGQALMGEIRREATGRSALVITHRLVGLEAADEILVLAGGRIVERGRFESLVEAGGPFRQMLDRQRAAHAVETFDRR
jgi:thiol reductant ABC exporter CydC subunit